MEAERFENHEDPGRGNCQPYNFVLVALKWFIACLSGNVDHQETS